MHQRHLDAENETLVVDQRGTQMDPQPRMQSEQESALESLLENSFGASSFYFPEKFLKGNARREPADLVWFDQDFVGLFYMTKSTQDLTRQINHNLRQENGFKRLWRSGDERFQLRGHNRFGDTCNIKHSSVKYHLTVFVVSSDCGVIGLSAESDGGTSVRVVMNEKLVKSIGLSNGTIVDLLNICYYYIISDDCRDLSNQESASLIESLTLFINYNEIYADTYHPERKSLSLEERYHHKVAFDTLKLLRRPSNPLGMETLYTIDERDEYESVARVFGDFSIGETIHLTKTVVQTLKMAGAPNYKKCIMLESSTGKYPFVVAAGPHLELSNMISRAQQKGYGPAGPIGAFGLIYTNSDENWLAPVCSWAPKGIKNRQATEVLEKLYLEIDKRQPK